MKSTDFAVHTGHKNRYNTISNDSILSNIPFRKMNTTSLLYEMNTRFKPTSTLKPVHYADLRYYPWTLATNVGAPYNISERWISHVKSKYALGLTTDARLSKHNMYNEFFVNNRYLTHLIKLGKLTDSHNNDLRYWNTAFARLQLVRDDRPDKVRLVFGAPTLLLQTEMPYIWPIQISLLSRGEDSPMLWGYETILGGWYRLRNYFSYRHPRLQTFFEFDWSGFDRDARHTIIRDIHAKWQTWFDFTSYWPTKYYEDTTPASGRAETQFHWMCNAVLSTPLAMLDGTLYRFNHSGIFSGFLQTQILDSCYNTVMIFTILHAMGFDISKVALKVQGDDSIGGLLDLITPSHYESFLSLFSYYAHYYFGASLNMSHSRLAPDLDCLSVLKYGNKGGHPIRDKYELLAMLKMPERSQKLGALASRAIGIAYANCGYHHDVYLICKDIYDHLTNDLNVQPDPLGVPDASKAWIYGFDDELPYDLGHFPTYLETIQRLQDPPRSLLSERHWPTDIFFGTPN